MKRWFVIQVYAGYEDVVKKDLELRIPKEGMENHFGEILIPSGKLKEFFTAAEAKDQRLFPGYMLIEMDLIPETMHLVTSSPKVVKFLGGKDPAPLTKKEIEKIITNMKGEVVVPSSKPEFTENAEVDIIGGPFAGFVGIIDKVDMEAEKLTVMVSIFGRLTPVELSFDQVKK
ncbi:MAG: transcription termination/antitermination protein NusG [Candidatus Babeliales bacterium]|nr:transcription termination/antitermination protein NusG [Candidatus Babeliales bacterium]